MSRFTWQFGIGRIVFSSKRRHTRYIGDWSSDVCSSDLAIETRVVPFFKANPLRTVKRSSFDCFAEVIRIMQRGDHLTSEGLTRIRELAGRMNRGSQNPQRPYAGSPT